MTALQDALTALFVPADVPDRFDKAVGSAASLVIIDLEDAVPASARPSARESIAAYVPTADPGRLLVRINGTSSPDHAADLELLRRLAVEAPGVLAGVTVPGAEDPRALEAAAAAAGVQDMLALVESARGLDQAPELLTASVRVRLGFGALDFALDVGGDAPALLDHARISLALASRRAGSPAPLESPSTRIRDLDAVAAAAHHAAALGMGGMLAIHPSQLEVITGAFTPSAEEIAWAHRVIDAGEGAHRVDGEMVDAPVLARARRILTKETS